MNFKKRYFWLESKTKSYSIRSRKARDNKKEIVMLLAKKKALFLNQLDVGLNQKNEFSRELQYTIEFLKDYKELVVVLKNKTQLKNCELFFV